MRLIKTLIEQTAPARIAIIVAMILSNAFFLYVSQEALLAAGREILVLLETYRESWILVGAGILIGFSAWGLALPVRNATAALRTWRVISTTLGLVTTVICIRGLYDALMPHLAPLGELPSTFLASGAITAFIATLYVVIFQVNVNASLWFAGFTTVAALAIS